MVIRTRGEGRRKRERELIKIQEKKKNHNTRYIGHAQKTIQSVLEQTLIQSTGG